jgi:hypothetical protein
MLHFQNLERMLWKRYNSHCILFNIHERRQLGTYSKLADEDDKESDSEEEEDKVILCEDEKEIKIKKRKPKYVAPKYIFIFDDLSSELKDPIISQLVKKHRHFKSKVILSSQYILDIDQQSRRQMDYFILFGGINKDKLNMIYVNADLSISEDEFNKLYHYATTEKYNFLYMNTNTYSI